jgi:calcium/calmodulin-dependent protein kinase (CaM kinase) II/calcium/calmodulin-dependent protein kinase I/doublecortin-like kinase 3
MKIMDMTQRSESERANVWYEIGLLAKLNDEHVIRLHEFFHERDEVRSIHWFPYDRVAVVNADP